MSNAMKIKKPLTIFLKIFIKDDFTKITTFFFCIKLRKKLININEINHIEVKGIKTYLADVKNKNKNPMKKLLFFAACCLP